METAIACVQLDRLYLRWAMGKDLRETMRDMRLPEWKVRLAFRLFTKLGLPRFGQDRRNFELPWRKCEKSEKRRQGGVAPYEMALLIEDMNQEIRRVSIELYRKVGGDWDRFVKRLNNTPPSWLKGSRTQVVLTKGIIGRFAPKGWKLREIGVLAGWEPAVVNIEGRAQRALRLRRDEFLKRYLGIF